MREELEEFDKSHNVLDARIKAAKKDDTVIIPRARYEQLLEIEWMYNDLQD